MTPTVAGGAVPSTTTPTPFVVTYEACRDVAAGVWRMRVRSIRGGVTIRINTGGSRDPDATPPTTEAQARDAVTVMKGYYARGSRGSWHTAGASSAHEQHHYAEWRCSADHYWPATRTAIQGLSVPLASAANAAAAVAAMRPDAVREMARFRARARTYFFALPDNASSRPYAAGQLALNPSIGRVQALATTRGWTVPAGVDTPSAANPCFRPFP